jgi:hypothetical protein
VVKRPGASPIQGGWYLKIDRQCDENALFSDPEQSLVSRIWIQVVLGFSLNQAI